MKIRINRTPSEPPTRDYSKRDTDEAAAERLAALTALKSLKVGHSMQFTGEDVSRDQINNFIAALQRRGITYQLTTAKVPGGIGVWRTS